MHVDCGLSIIPIVYNPSTPMSESGYETAMSSQEEKTETKGQAMPFQDVKSQTNDQEQGPFFLKNTPKQPSLQ